MCNDGLIGMPRERSFLSGLAPCDPHTLGSDSLEKDTITRQLCRGISRKPPGPQRAGKQLFREGSDRLTARA